MRNRASEKHLRKKRFIEELLSNEKWYGDGKPSFEWAETREESAAAMASTIWFLRKWGKQDPNLLLIKKRLETCKPMKRCMSPACPMCGRAYQRAFVALYHNTVKGYHDAERN
jgi:hypothetical protein